MLDLISYVKKRIPDTMLERAGHRKRMQTVEAHKAMSRYEVISWLSQTYSEAIGADLNLDDPQRYTEKIQWCKLNAMDAVKSELADKLAVRKWVEEKIGGKYLIPLLGSWENPDDIDFGMLPNSFVLKTNNASGTNIIVPDKSKINEKLTRLQLKHWLQEDFGWYTFEPQYLKIPPRIIAEEFISNDDGSEIEDYKFLCFSGEPRYLWVDIDRHVRHSRVVFDLEWNAQPWILNQNYPRASIIPSKPECFDEMVRLARILADGFAHVRVDFYSVEGEPRFGEMTFTTEAGFAKTVPDEWDYKLGALWDLSKEPESPFLLDTI